MSDYASFLARKAQCGGMAGFAPTFMPDYLFPFQSFLDEWAIRKGKSAVYADCGLGKSIMGFVWAENVVRHTNKPVLILTPIAIAKQMQREAEKFGIEAHVSRDGSVKPNITITNYEQLHKFNPDDYSGVVGDEIACIKADKGVKRDTVTEFLRTVRYRLLCTATAAPNDYIELGTASEALGEMGQRDMITMFFKQETKKDYLGWGRTKYRMKGHAEIPFWRWVCSWARACRRPSDLGFSDDGFVLPPLIENDHVVNANMMRPGFLCEMPAMNMQEEREERRRTIRERCEKAAELVSHPRASVVWCHLNDEADLLEKMISGSRQVKGDQDVEEREELYEAFTSGELKRLIIKPVIGAWGANWQHCNHAVAFGSHSWEQRYQLVRRFWRFGQKDSVTIDTVVSEGEQRVTSNMARKADQCDRMFSQLVANMNYALTVDRYEYSGKEELPSWLS